MIKSEIIADSINSVGNRLTTFVLEYPRYIHSELLTHRVFSKNSASCLSGDTVICIEKTSAIKNGSHMKHTNMTIQEIVDKWIHGDALGRDMKTRIKSMNLRCLNEETGEFVTTNISNCIESGKKEIYEIELTNRYIIRCTLDHKLFSESGWITLRDLGLYRSEKDIIIWNKGPKIFTNGYSLDEILKDKSEGLSLTAISNKRSILYKSLSYFCEKHRIFFRKKQCLKENLDYKNKQWLQNKLQEGLFSWQIADICNTTIDRIKKSIKKHGLHGNKWHWGKKETWNKGKKYHLPYSSLTNVRKYAITRSKPESYLLYKVFENKMVRFLTEIRSEILQKYNYTCQLSGNKDKLELHHIDPVWHNKDLAFDKNNIILILKLLHRYIHNKNLDLEFLDWFKSGKDLKEFYVNYINIKKQKYDINKPLGRGNHLVARLSEIKNIKFIGLQDTYDLEVNGPYHNFIANGIIVHNSRAIPTEKFIEFIKTNPAMPTHWGKNQSGMQSFEELPADKIEECTKEWLLARDNAITSVLKLKELGLHKQIANRILEPWFHIRIILSATEFSNFFALRAHKDAHPDLQKLAFMMLDQYNASVPSALKEGEWHIPFGDKIDQTRLNELEITVYGPRQSNTNYWYQQQELKKKIAIARCARVSYFNFDGKDDYEIDVILCDRLFANSPKHLSPAEHVALAMNDSEWYGNFKGWKQYRKFFIDENLQDTRIRQTNEI